MKSVGIKHRNNNGNMKKIRKLKRLNIFVSNGNTAEKYKKAAASITGPTNMALPHNKGWLLDQNK
jgi:hypothetical protein